LFALPAAGTCPICCAAVSRWFPVSPVAASFEVARITARAAACPTGDEHTGDEQHGKEDVKEDVVHLISHKLKCAQGMDVLGWLGITIRTWTFIGFSIYHPTGSPGFRLVQFLFD
jgi:hypothetical protein